MSILSSLSQILLIIVLVINTLLAYIIFRDNKKSATNVIFAILSVITSLWLLLIHNTSSPTSSFTVLWYTRLTVFLAIPQSVLFFLLAHTLPSSSLLLKKSYLRLTLILTPLVMGLTLTPYVFKEVLIVGQNVQSIPGPGMPLFALFTSFFSLAAIYVLIKKIKNSTGEIKDQLKLMMHGILLMLGLIITTIMIPVMLFQNQTFIPFSPVYALIFLGMTAYAIVKHHLFNLKVIATEAFTVLLWIILFSKVFIAGTIGEKLIDFFVLITTIIFGALLIKSVRREVEQREQLQELTAQLGEANQQLQSLDKARSEFITIASHQLRTPPATIKWFLSSILQGDYGKVPTELAPTIEKANRTNNSLISLIDDMLNVSRIERGKMEFLFQESDLLELVKITFEQLLPIATDKKLQLTLNAPKTVPKIMADKEKIRQVMNNFIDNAIKYTKAGSISVNLAVVGPDIEFRVTDSGKGFTFEEKGEIFEKFKRGKESSKQSAGLGLGLYVAKVIVEEHKGKIWAESSGTGQGSSFVFTVPIHNNLKETTLVDLTKTQN